uniref:glycoside hydrolase family 113 n=1 Tax=Flavobacterium sp. TaxID=239 RepID=UPI00404B3FE8
MKNKLLIIILIMQMACSQNKKINGISFVASDRKISEKEIIPVEKTNANWVTLMPFAFMKTETDTAIYFNNLRQWFGERKEGIEHTAGIFHQKKIQVMLKPQIWIPNGGFTGFIAMKTEEEWLTLEKNYADFILFYAKVAQETGCELLCIGTELNRFVTARPDFWQQLIARIKSVYKGKITYAENWDSYQKVSFIEQLDFIGVDAYFPLAKSKHPTISEIETAWKPLKNELKSFSEKHQKQILFTEYGYQSKTYTTLEPWNHWEKDTVFIEGQSNALLALYQQFWEEDWFAGGFLWKWFDNHEQVGGLLDADYTVQNKTAEKIVTKQYGKFKD